MFSLNAKARLEETSLVSKCLWRLSFWQVSHSLAEGNPVVVKEAVMEIGRCTVVIKAGPSQSGQTSSF